MRWIKESIKQLKTQLNAVDSAITGLIDKSGTVSFADISAMRSNVGSQLTNITIAAAIGGGAGGGGEGLTPMHSGTSGIVIGEKSLSKLDFTTRMITPLDWAQAVDQVLIDRNVIAQSESESLQNQQLGPDSAQQLSSQAQSTVCSDLHVHRSRDREVNSSKEPHVYPPGSMEQKLLAADEYFDSLLMNKR